LQVDSLNGFKQASEKVNDLQIKQVFKTNENLSLEMRNELNSEILRLGGEVKTKGTIKGAVNHIWMNLKAEVGHEQFGNFLKNIIFCEEFNIDRYEHVIAHDMPPGIKVLLNDHLETLNARVKTLKALDPASL
jgi:uncharacterized protein (TIGR02284 family)